MLKCKFQNLWLQVLTNTLVYVWKEDELYNAHKKEMSHNQHHLGHKMVKESKFIEDNQWNWIAR